MLCFSFPGVQVSSWTNSRHASTYHDLASMIGQVVFHGVLRHANKAAWDAVRAFVLSRTVTKPETLYAESLEFCKQTPDNALDDAGGIDVEGMLF